MRFDHHVYLDPATSSLLRGINSKLDSIIANQEIIMATLEQVLTDVTAEATDIAGISKLIAGLKQQLADALAGTTLPPAVQAQVDQIFAQAESNKAAIAAALATNTP
jgi:hypothetical protein